MLISYCQCAVATAEAMEELKKGGMFDAAGVANPWHGVWLKRVRTLATLSRLLRITPMARQPRYAPKPRPQPWHAKYHQPQEQGLDDED
jgi:hypothetical protein